MPLFYNSNHSQPKKVQATANISKNWMRIMTQNNTLI